ncbi:hypothetical protein AURDEDRAFT_184822 [Auricularia subglabra TFB-10046 SS5]|nr:hypothetical protein AURDEDRAFT_184822 [Auricularia subglabra TFB-10046 SS5]
MSAGTLATPPGGIEALIPAEVLSGIMDFLGLESLLRASAVNTRWREVGLDHPTYWRDITLRTTTAARDQHLFVPRLDRAHGRPVKIAISIGPAEPHGPRLSSFSLAIKLHLAHTEQLELAVFDEHIEDISDMLNHPAPMLRSIMLKLSYADPDPLHAPSLRQDFLGGHAPVLKDVNIFAVSLPTPVPRCFQNVKGLRIGSWPFSPMVVPNVFSGCPRLRTLRLVSEFGLDDVFWNPEAWSTIQRLCLEGPPIASSWTRLGLPLAAVPSVTIRVYQGPGVVESLSGIAQLLRGSLSMTLLWADPVCLSISLGGTPDHFNRDVEVYGDDHESTSPAPGSNIAGAFCGRLVRLIMNLADWPLVSCLGSLPVLEQLALRLGPEIDWQIPEPARLTCPSLKFLILSTVHKTAQTITLDSDVVDAFAMAAFADASFPVLVGRQGIDLLDFPRHIVGTMGFIHGSLLLFA